MKKIFAIAMLATAMVACGTKTEKTTVATDFISDSVATAIVPEAATEVLPVASPVPGLGVVATDVVPAE